MNPQFRIANLDIRSAGVDANTPPGHYIATGFDPLGNYRVFLYAGTGPDDDRYVGSILIPKDTKKQAIAYSARGGYVTSSGTEAEKLATLVARAANES